MNKTLLLLSCLILIFAACTNKPSTAEVNEQHVAYNPENYYTPNGNRTTAEWEPAIGTQVTWPLCVPHNLLVELSKDNHLYTLVENEESRQEAEMWFQKWGIKLDAVTFLFAPQDVDAWWTRDWGPHGVFNPEGVFQLGDPKYLYATPMAKAFCSDSLFISRKLVIAQLPDDSRSNVPPYKTQIDDDMTIPIAEQLGMPLLDLPFVSTGGNFLTDGMGSAFSSCIITEENKLLGNTPEAFFELNESLLGITNYHILSNFEQPAGIQHLDCMMKVIDEETLLVAEPPEDHAAYQVYEDIVNNELAQLKTIYGRPYIIKRIKIDTSNTGLAAYTNSLILNETVYVPLFDIALDAEAINTWQEIMPGYEVKGFTFFLDDEPEEVITQDLKNHYGDYGWNSGDALHCRTRAVWDPEMLFISVKKINETSEPGRPLTVHATIIDYSGKGLVEDSATLHWRQSGSDEWNVIPLNKTPHEAHLYANIPPQSDDSQFEYFIEVKSKSGKTETRPSSAPNGYYQGGVSGKASIN